MLFAFEAEPVHRLPPPGFMKLVFMEGAQPTEATHQGWTDFGGQRHFRLPFVPVRMVDINCGIIVEGLWAD